MPAAGCLGLQHEARGIGTGQGNTEAFSYVRKGTYLNVWAVQHLYLIPVSRKALKGFFPPKERDVLVMLVPASSSSSHDCSASIHDPSPLLCMPKVLMGDSMALGAAAVT